MTILFGLHLDIPLAMEAENENDIARYIFLHCNSRLIKRRLPQNQRADSDD
jgi:hypothetical protein